MAEGIFHQKRPKIEKVNICFGPSFSVLRFLGRILFIHKNAKTQGKQGVRKGSKPASHPVLVGFQPTQSRRFVQQILSALVLSGGTSFLREVSTVQRQCFQKDGRLEAKQKHAHPIDAFRVYRIMFVPADVHIEVRWWICDTMEIQDSCQVRGISALCPVEFRWPSER